MNILNSQIQKQGFETQEMVCQNHNSQIVAIDLDISEKGQYQYMCSNCLVEKINSNKISTIEQTKERIQILKTQKQKNKAKENQYRLDYFKKILDQIMDFKCNVDGVLEKIYSQIKAQIFTIQNEKSSLSETFQSMYNFQDDVKSLSDFLSTDPQYKQLEFEQDSQFIDQIFNQFELLFNNASYFQTIHTFKDAKQKINEVNENMKFEILGSQSKNNKKTPTLGVVCPTHQKEIIMIDIDTKNRNMEDRFACVDCISDRPNYQYRTIEKVNQEWNQAKNQQDRFINELKTKREEKYENLNKQIARMRKNYNQQLNDISDKIIAEFSQPITKTVEICKFKQTSIQGLNQDELVQSISYLIQYDKENVIQDSKIEYMKSKDSLLSKEIETRLEHLKQHDQLDIQESLNILQDVSNDNQIQGILVLSKQIQEINKVNQEQLIVKQELDELINSSKSIYCQIGLFNETIHNFQEHQKKINYVNNKIKSIPDQDLTNLQKQVQDYNDKFENDFKYLKKFCENQKLETNLDALKLDYEKFQQNNQMKIEDQNIIIDQLKEIEKAMESKLKNTEDELQILNLKLQEEQNKYVESLKELSIQNECQIQELNQKIGQQDNLVNQMQKELELKEQLYEEICQKFEMTFILDQFEF